MERKKFTLNSKEIEWEQSLEDVIVYINLGEGVRAKNLECVMTTNHLTVGLRGASSPYIDNDLTFSIKPKDSTWTIEEGVLKLELTKMAQAQPWASLFHGVGDLNPQEAEEVKKKIMLERFQNEHSGFNFEDAEFSGQVPDPQTFMISEN